MVRIRVVAGLFAAAALATGTASLEIGGGTAFPLRGLVSCIPGIEGARWPSDPGDFEAADA